jgi:hypothetical protein
VAAEERTLRHPHLARVSGQVLQEEVFDYIREALTGGRGNETAKILERMRGLVKH